jgi:hypothetical protein
MSQNKKMDIATAIIEKNPMIEAAYAVQTEAALQTIEFFVSLGMTTAQAIEAIK